MNNINRPVTKIEDFPKPGSQGSENFWKYLDDPEYHKMLLWMILNELRKHDPSTMSKQQAFAALCRLKTMQEQMDLPAWLSAQLSDKDTPNDNPFDK